MKTYTTSEILDYLCDAVVRYTHEGERGINRVFFHHMDSDAHLAFDLFLVKTKDELAYQAGTTESRFRMRVKQMARVKRSEISET